MIYFFYNNNFVEANKKAKKLFSDLQKKKRDATFVSLDFLTVSETGLREVLESQGLFESKIVCFLSRILENKELSLDLKKILKDMKESSTIFIWVESNLKKSDIELLSKYSEKSSVEETKEKINKTEFNVFSLGDAFGQRDRKKFWKLVLEVKKRGIPGEEIHGILWWQLKSMILSVSSKNSEESGLKPFVYSKSKTFAKNFTEKELQNMADKLVLIYHEAHRGKLDLYDGLEKIALEI